MTQLTPLPSQVQPATRSGIRVAIQLLRALAARGVRTAFGIPGGAVGPIFDALAEVPQIELVATRQESTAVFAAIGHARATGTPAVVLVTSGPGVTNTLTGVACALAEEVPLIVIGGDVATAWAGRGAFQDSSHLGLDVVSLMRQVTRWSSSVFSPSIAAGAVARAWSAATGARPGPVFLSVPYDVAQGTTTQARLALPQDAGPLVPDEAACHSAAELLASATRPLLVLGSGARGALAESVALAEQLASPVVVTSHAKGVFPETHPLYLGLVGNAGHPSATEYVASRPDVVCIVGSRLGDFATNAWALAIGGRDATIQIDRDPLLIGRNAPVTLGIVGDAGLALEAMRVACADVRPPVRACLPLRKLPWSTTAPAGLVKPQAVIESIGRAFEDAVFCSDIGEHMGFAQHYLTVDGPDRFHCMTGLGSMGSGFGAAIGIQHARPAERVVAFVGDGGFHMHVSELLTCVERRIGLVLVVFNDGCWSMVEHGFRAVFRRKPSQLPQAVADIASIARSYGADARRIDGLEQLEPERLRALPRRGVPLVLDVRIDPSESLSRGTRSRALGALRCAAGGE